MMMISFRRLAGPVCRSSARHPLAWFLITLALSVPSFLEFRKIGLDTNLVRLLPSGSRAAGWTRKLQDAAGDQGYFTIVFEGRDRSKLLEAVQSTAERVKRLDGIASAEYRYPLEFIERYRYLLVPDFYLEKILDYMISLEAEVSPMGTDLLEETSAKSSKDKQEDDEMKRLLDRYSHLTAYHQSPDGRIMGIFIRPEAGLTKITDLRKLFHELEAVAGEASRQYGLWPGVGGSQVENLREYDIILRDLKISGAIGTLAILLVLLLSFRSLLALPVLLYPLGLGLLWSFSLVPPVLGDLNIITSFLILVLFGLGIDFSIHLVKRFQLELSSSRTPEEALVETYTSTGSSVVISGLNTALALLVLVFSDFRGFSEYGLICGGSLVLTLLSMFLVMPPVLILGHRLKFIKSDRAREKKGRLPSRRLSWLIAGALLFSFAAAAVNLRFDYDFNKLKPDIPQSGEFRRRNREVYAHYMSPGAVFVTPDLAATDKLIDIIKTEMSDPGSLIQRTTNIRDYAPNDAQTAARLALIGQIKEQVRGRWIERVEDPDVARWIEDIRGWTPPERQPRYEELPSEIKEGLEAMDGSGRFLVGVYPNVPRGNGRNAMAFTKELYSLDLPEGVKGPVGEMPVFAEILWVVSSEGPWVIAATLFCVVLLVFIGNRSLRRTVWTIFPLAGGIILTFGAMAAFGIRLNFFNVVVIPTLIGLGEDHGVHYYRRWIELNRDTARTQQELLGPLTACTVTTQMGYIGMMIASHPGLRSIGTFACLGMACIWIVSLLLFPAILERRRRASAGSSEGKDP